uniref:MPN domain-containing protein n=1 Tax=Kwoniella dejecticola CBS 10117 TaxID=1296121 RepID=A0A1A6A104_9TREE|nr:uncharacterized protein I303_06013 [Kwoniella dejecticola CBS 10117]OBR83733.1 hypothetical protein I303_06013 [Kwoniella dejecticola CBS 10117]
MSTSTSASSTSSSSHSYSLSSTAYTLPILHAARHPSSSVLGVFLGPISSTQTQVDPKSESQALIEVDEAIPLIHSYTNLSPITEIALSLVTEYANLRKKRIVGIYLAKEYGNDSLTRSAERILGALREQQRFDGVFALVLDNDKLSKGEFAYIPTYPSWSPGRIISSHLPSHKWCEP